jgi:DNA-binding FadR family transcriptional regulator
MMTRPEGAAEEHRRIVDAIERGDADGAELAARVHIQNAQEACMKMLFD